MFSHVEPQQTLISKLKDYLQSSHAGEADHIRLEINLRLLQTLLTAAFDVNQEDLVLRVARIASRPDEGNARIKLIVTYLGL